MVNNKSPGNDGPTKEIYETCCDKIIDLFYKYVKYVEIKKRTERFTRVSCHKVDWKKG